MHAAVGLALAAFAGCNNKVPSGDGISDIQFRTTEGFHSVELLTGGAVTLRSGTEVALRVEADRNLIDNLKTEVRDSVLRIYFDREVNYRLTPLIRVDVPGVLRRIRVVGGGLVSETNARNALQSEFRVEGTGSIQVQTGSISQTTAQVVGLGAVNLVGQTDQLNVQVDGSGEVQALSLPARSAQAVVNGSGQVYVAASDSLVAAVYGSGKVFYSGSPRIRSLNNTTTGIEPVQ